MFEKFKKTKYFIDKFMEHDLLTLAAALSFYTSFSLAPLILIVLYLLGLWSEKAQGNFIEQVQEVIGPEAGNALITIIESTQEQTSISQWGGILGAITLIFSASGVFSQLLYSMNKIWNVANKDTSSIFIWIKRRVLSIGIILAMIFLSISSLVASTVIRYIITMDKGMWTIVNYFGTFFLLSFVFAVLIKYLPECRISWKNSLIGGFATSVLYLIGKYLIGLYLAHSPLSTAYGAAGTLVVFLIWVYYSTIIVFSGALVTETLENSRN